MTLDQFLLLGSTTTKDLIVEDIMKVTAYSYTKSSTITKDTVEDTVGIALINVMGEETIMIGRNSVGYYVTCGVLLLLLVKIKLLSKTILSDEQ